MINILIVSNSLLLGSLNSFYKLPFISREYLICLILVMFLIVLHNIGGDHDLFLNFLRSQYIHNILFFKYIYFIWMNNHNLYTIFLGPQYTFFLNFETCFMLPERFSPHTLICLTPLALHPLVKSTNARYKFWLFFFFEFLSFLLMYQL